VLSLAEKYLSTLNPNVADLLQKRARVCPPGAEYFTVREILAEASTVRPELTAKASCRWWAVARG